MTDYTDQITWAGSVEKRGFQVIQILRLENKERGSFIHNGVDIIVYQDSTEREIMWQYEAKSAI